MVFEDEKTGYYIDFALHAFQRSIRKFQSAVRSFGSEDYNEAVIATYFSTYHATRAVLGLKGFFFERREGTRKYFNYQFVKTEVFPHYTAKILSHLEYERLKAEYDVEYEVPRIVAAREVIRGYLFNFLSADFFQKVTRQNLNLLQAYSKEVRKLAFFLSAHEKKRLAREVNTMAEEFLCFPKDPPDAIKRAIEIMLDGIRIQHPLDAREEDLGPLNQCF